MGLSRTVRLAVTAPLRRIVELLVAPTEEERKRDVEPPDLTREERAEATTKHLDDHYRERQARRHAQSEADWRREHGG